MDLDLRDNKEKTLLGECPTLLPASFLIRMGHDSLIEVEIQCRAEGDRHVA